MPPSEVTGIHQSDVVIGSAIMAAIEDVRANDWLLDYAFASLPRDTLTRDKFGEKEIENAKKWFRSTQIPVFLSVRIDEPKFPCISVSIVNQSEGEQVLGDTHYVENQEDGRVWPALTPAFTPTSYSPQTGVMRVPTEIGDGLVFAPGMQLIDRTGRAHEVLESPDRYTLVLPAGITASFRDTVVKGKPPSSIVHLESVRMRETYSVGSHVQGEPTHLTYLHTILLFCMLRYKARLLEARGFERSELSASEFRRNEFFEMENVFSRHTNINGYVQQSWPGDIVPKMTSVTTQTRRGTPTALPAPGDSNDALWLDEQDPLVLAASRAAAILKTS